MFKHSTFPRVALLSIALACAGVAQAQMKDNEYAAARDRVEAEYKTAKQACDRLSGNAKDVCQAEAKGQGAVTYKGRLIDIASVRQAQVIVKMAELIAG